MAIPMRIMRVQGRYREVSSSRIESIWHECHRWGSDHQGQWSGQKSAKGLWVWESAWVGEEREKTLEITVSIFVRWSSWPGLVWSCCNFATSGYLCYSREGRIFSHSMLMEEILPRDTIQIKYALWRTVWFWTEQVRGCFTMTIWNSGHPFFLWQVTTQDHMENSKICVGWKETQDVKLSCWFGKWYPFYANDFFLQKELNGTFLG